MAKRPRIEPRLVDAKRGERGAGVFDASEMRIRIDDRTILTHPASSIDFERVTPRTRTSK
jgi:hypothetical protein